MALVTFFYCRAGLRHTIHCLWSQGFLSTCPDRILLITVHSGNLIKMKHYEESARHHLLLNATMMSGATTSFSNIPFDVLFDILQLLTLGELLRIGQVSRYLCA